MAAVSHLVSITPNFLVENHHTSHVISSVKRWDVTTKIFSSLIRLDSSTAKNNCHEVTATLHVNFYRQEAHTRTLTVDLRAIEAESEFIKIRFSGSVNQRDRSVTGQCTDEILRYWGHIPEVAELCRLWERWTSNDNRLGTRDQNAALEGVSEVGFDDYERWIKTYLIDVGLYCDHGYFWGSDTLIEIIPSEVLSKIEQVVERLKTLMPTFEMKECVNA